MVLNIWIGTIFQEELNEAKVGRCMHAWCKGVSMLGYATALTLAPSSISCFARMLCGIHELSSH
jgi:hypothetical protein